MRKGLDGKKPFIGRRKVVVMEGLRYAAKELGCHEQHLRKVLQGKRKGKSLTDRVRAKFPALLEVGK